MNEAWPHDPTIEVRPPADPAKRDGSRAALVRALAALCLGLADREASNVQSPDQTIEEVTYAGR